MADKLLRGLIGGVEGGTKAQGSKLRQDAEELRRISFAKLGQQYSQQNAEFIDRLTRGRQAEARTADIAQEDKLYRRDVERKDVERQQRIEDVGIIEGMKDKRGTTGKLFDDLSGIFGDEEAKQILKGSMSAKQTQKGALSEKNKADLLMTMKEEYMASGAAGEGTPGESNWFSADIEEIPAQAMMEWASTQPGWNKIVPMLTGQEISGDISELDIQGDELTASLMGDKPKKLDTTPAHKSVDKKPKSGIISSAQESPVDWEVPPEEIPKKAKEAAASTDDTTVKRLAKQIGASKDKDLITKWFAKLKARLVELRSE